jgi:hypothetical protein
VQGADHTGAIFLFASSSPFPLCGSPQSKLEASHQILTNKGDVAAGYAYKHIYSLLERLSALHPHITAELLRKELEALVGVIKNIGGSSTPGREQVAELVAAADAIVKTAQENASTHTRVVDAARGIRTAVGDMFASSDMQVINTKKDQLKNAMVDLSSAVSTAFPQRDEVVAGLDGLGRLIDMRNGRSITEMLGTIFPSNTATVIPAAAAAAAATAAQQQQQQP